MWIWYWGLFHISGNKIQSHVRTALEAIHLAKNEAMDDISSKGYDENIIDFNTVYCDIIYNIGASLQVDSGYTYELAEYDEGPKFHLGVEYTETVKFVKTESEYCLKMKPKKTLPMDELTTSGQSLSYVVYTYELEQEMENIINDKGVMYEAPMANFKTEINVIDDEGKSSYDEYDIKNEIDTTPTYKEEYLLGISTKENVDSNIYIERGINAAFEKHLKLQEISSMEGLLNYGNGFFKIMNS